MRNTEINQYQQAEQVMDNALATLMHTTQCVVNRTMKTTSEELSYRTDIFVKISQILINLSNDHFECSTTNSTLPTSPKCHRDC